MREGGDMVAQEDRARRYTVEEWRGLLEHGEVNYEYHHGWIVAMAGGTADHAQTAYNAQALLSAGLEGTPCRAYNSDLAVRLAPSEYRFPDVTVTCDERDRGRVREIQSPRVVIEVLSDSTQQEDRTTKFALYRACPSVQEYMLIITAYRAVEVYRRAEPRWTFEGYGPGDTVVLESIDVRLPVDQLYRLTDVPLPGPAAPAPESAAGPHGTA
jgi:Uma2 family endonuclease